MKRASEFCIVALVVLGGCSVDVGKLRAPSAVPPDGAANQPDAQPAGSPDGPLWVADTLPATFDAPDMVGALPDAISAVPDAIHDVVSLTDGDGEGGNETTGGLDTLDCPTSAGLDTIPDDVLLANPDLPESSPDLPPPGDDAADAGGAAPDQASPGADSPVLPDLVPDLAPPADLGRDAGGRANGLSCTTSDQCSSGYCVGVPGTCCTQACTGACYQPSRCTGGSCVTLTGAVTCGSQDAVCGLVVNDPANAGQWSLQADIQVGDLALGSDAYPLTAVSASVAGFPWIRPSRSSKSAMADPLVTFTLSAPADIYVGLDTRVAVPSWLSSWTDSGASVSYSAPNSVGPPTTVTQRLLKASFSAGSVALGPLACGTTANCSMYLTIIRFADQPSGALACQ